MRVLVVEDSHRLADVVAEGLRDQGMAVDVAYDGREAAAKLDINAYEVVVLDRTCRAHGDALCRMITERDDPVMILMLTASGSAGDRVAGLKLGADDYLSKPFHFPELVLRVRALARRQPTARDRIYRAAWPRARIPRVSHCHPGWQATRAVCEGVRRPRGPHARRRLLLEC